MSRTISQKYGSIIIGYKAMVQLYYLFIRQPKMHRFAKSQNSALFSLTIY